MHGFTGSSPVPSTNFYLNDGALVYRLGHEIFILGRGVRFPWALQFTELKCII